ncbi:probable F-box protein At2g36090 [Rhodamnia argentea]|uniref:Probable F-box protein At2g36090 n=1 Tax=Rhodamnia argentea TaxID=178133 RepID=A0A8B8PCM3_9MYRT|nr:probable F-box protein At2g36090 [Rhodamnia argentea]
MRPPPPPSSANTTGGEDTATSFSDIHHDILRSHILIRLDGPALASASCVCSHLRALSSDERLWADVSRSTWPSINAPRVCRVISSFPGGHRSFFADAYPLLADGGGSPSTAQPPPPDLRRRSSELISAVDIRYRGQLIFSKTAETETETGWFRCSPFLINMLEPKDAVPTPVPFPSPDEACGDLGDSLRLSWVLIDPEGRRAMDLSSTAPVSIQRHWLTGEVHARFATVLSSGERGTAAERVACTIAVTCGGSRRGTMQVSEVNVQVEDMEGTYLNGGNSLVILRRAMEGKRGKKTRGEEEEEEGRRRYEDFLERRRERRERRARAEWALDAVCVGFGSAALVVFWLFILCR